MCDCDNKDRSPRPGDQTGALVGRFPHDLTSWNGNVRQVQIPKRAKGLMVSFMADNNGNVEGNVYIYLGEVGPAPWCVLPAPAGPFQMTIACGPLGEVIEGGTYLTVIPSTGPPPAGNFGGGGGAGSQGIILLEFVDYPVKRSFSF